MVLKAKAADRFCARDWRCPWLPANLSDGADSGQAPEARPVEPTPHSGRGRQDLSEYMPYVLRPPRLEQLFDILGWSAQHGLIATNKDRPWLLVDRQFLLHELVLLFGIGNFMSSTKPKNTICLWFNKDAQDAARFYAFNAMMEMGKIDIAQIEAARRGS
jgi:hypothetical protein